MLLSMKHRLTTTFVFSTLVLGLPMLRTSLSAAEHAAAAKEPAGSHSALADMAKQLDLTDEQKAAITPILKKEIADLQALKVDTSLRKMQRARKARDIASTASKEIRSQLNPEQQKKYDVLREEWKKQAKAKERKAQEDSGA